MLRKLSDGIGIGPVDFRVSTLARRANSAAGYMATVVGGLSFFAKTAAAQERICAASHSPWMVYYLITVNNTVSESIAPAIHDALNNNTCGAENVSPQFDPCNYEDFSKIITWVIDKGIAVATFSLGGVEPQDPKIIPCMIAMLNETILPNLPIDTVIPATLTPSNASLRPEPKKDEVSLIPLVFGGAAVLFTTTAACLFAKKLYAKQPRTADVEEGTGTELTPIRRS